LGLEGSGLRVQGSGFRAQGSGLRVQGSGFRAQGSGFKVQGSGFRVQGSGFRVQDEPSGFRVQGSGFRVQDERWGCFLGARYPCTLVLGPLYAGPPSWDPTVGSCLGPYGGPRAVSYERGTPVEFALELTETIACGDPSRS